MNDRYGKSTVRSRSIAEQLISGRNERYGAASMSEDGAKGDTRRPEKDALWGVTILDKRAENDALSRGSGAARHAVAKLTEFGGGPVR